MKLRPAIPILRHPLLYARRQAAKPAPGNEKWRGPVALLLFLAWLALGILAILIILPQ